MKERLRVGGESAFRRGAMRLVQELEGGGKLRVGGRRLLIGNEAQVHGVGRRAGTWAAGCVGGGVAARKYAQGLTAR